MRNTRTAPRKWRFLFGENSLDINLTTLFAFNIIEVASEICYNNTMIKIIILILIVYILGIVAVYFMDKMVKFKV